MHTPGLVLRTKHYELTYEYALQNRWSTNSLQKTTWTSLVNRLLFRKNRVRKEFELS